MAQVRLPHPLLQPSPRKEFLLAPGQAGFAGDRKQRGCPHSPQGSLGVRSAEINLNDPVFSGDVSQSESAPMRPPFPLSAAQETLYY